MRILITGGAGYKGLKLAPALLELGHEVTILDNFMYGYSPALFLFSYPKVSFIQKDIRNLNETDVSSYDIIYHLAGISGYPACEANPNSAEMINVYATQKMVSFLSKDQILVYASTTSFYGKSSSECTEHTSINPVSHYGQTKYQAEQICLERQNSISFRFATLFGVSSRMRWDLMPNDFVMRAVQERNLVLFDSNSIRTFLHVDDAIQAYLMVLNSDNKMLGNVFNVGNQEMNLSKFQLSKKISKHLEFTTIESNLSDSDIRSFIINFDKINLLGYKPQKTLDAGIKELIKLFQFYKPSQPYIVI